MPVTTLPTNPPDFAAATLYLDDVDEIIGVMVRAVGGPDTRTHVKILVNDQGKAVDTTAELRNLPKQQSRDFSIFVRREDSVLDLIIMRSSVGFVDEGDVSKASLLIAQDRIRSIFAARKHAWRTFVRSTFDNLSPETARFIGAALLAFSVFSFIRQRNNPNFKFHFEVGTLLTAIAVSAPFYSGLYHSKVVFISNADKLQRERETKIQAATVVITHLLAFGVGVATAWAVAHYIK